MLLVLVMKVTATSSWRTVGLTIFCCCLFALWWHSGAETCRSCINNRPTRCNTKQSIYYSASLLYMFRVSSTPIIRSTHNTASGTGHIFCSATSLQCGQAWPRWREVAVQKIMTSTGGCSYSFVYSWWWVWLKPEICRVNLQNNK